MIVEIQIQLLRSRYIAHPFRLFGIGKKTDLTLVQQTYKER